MLAACMIVRDAGRMLREHLPALRPHVDGIFIYDTGSKDDTFDVVEELNRERTLTVEHEGSAVEVPLAPITIERGEWRDDFAWARQRSWEMPGSEYEWLVWLDDDDEIRGAGWLRHLALTAAPEVDGYVFAYDYARDEHGRCVCTLWRERLLRRSAGYRWVNPVHEVLVPAEGRTPSLVQIPAEQVLWVHHRPADRYAPDRNLRILIEHARKAEERGERPDPRTLAYLGTEHMAKGDFATAARYLHEYLAHPEARWSDERSQVWHKLATCMRASGNPMAAVEAEISAIKERDDWAENHVGLACAFAQLGRWDRAERWARAAYALGMPRSPLILNPLEFTLIPLLIVADACVNQGRYDAARDALVEAQQYAAGDEVARKLLEVERAARRADVLGAVHLLREILVRHDENAKAWQLLQAVPYFLEDDPSIVRARAEQREMVAHLLRPDEYRRWYEDEPKESTVGDEVVPEVGELIPRAKRLLEGLREQEEELGRKPLVLDLGGNDMWIACYLWHQGGYVVDGVELNRQSVEKGIARMARFGAPGRLVQGDLHDAPRLLEPGSYDAVCMFEVIEHVPDPDRALSVCERMLRPGGRVYLSTPNGAYERGMLDRWQRVERKGHLRAIPAPKLAAIAQERGEVVAMELQHGDRVTYLAYRPCRRKQRIVMYAGQQWEPWSPRSIREGGLGGSETCLVQVATRLAQAGHRVTVYSSAEEGLFAGALYRPWHAWDPTEECDLLIVSRRPDVLDNPVGARATALWCHDHSYPGLMTEERAARIDHVVVLSQWERDRFARLYPYLADKLVVIRNGITTAHFSRGARAFRDRKPRCVYSSSADRGLDVMLTVWPRIRERVPEAELHVFYGWDVFDRVAVTNPALVAYKQHVLALAAAAGGEEGGVFFRGRVGQTELAREMEEARVLSYPTAFLETSCITAMEARAAGLAIVTSDLGALKETVGRHGLLIPWGEDEDEPHNQTAEYQDCFVRHVVRLLTDKEAWTRWHERALQGVQGLDWDRRVRDWERLLPARRRTDTRRRAWAI
jgi:glycosyltransferase involved in cell wall biosynthesis/2-polyprenyl-3-methyl-5-hydroxy-6-metoxy-1,4-benzoquinol methylase